MSLNDIIHVVGTRALVSRTMAGTSTSATVPDGEPAPIRRVPPAASRRTRLEVRPICPSAEPPLDITRVDPTAIVGHTQPGDATSPYEFDPDVVGACVLDDIGQKLTCGSEKQTISRRPQ